MNMDTELDGTGIRAEKLIEASADWTGCPLPHYPVGQPVVTIMRLTFPPHSVTNTHLHEVINCGVVMRGTLTVVNADGSEHSFSAGDAIVETVGTVHHGENRGDEPVELVMFYAGDGTKPLSTPK